MQHRCAVLDDYQNVALKMADWSPLAKDVEISGLRWRPFWFGPNDRLFGVITEPAGGGMLPCGGGSICGGGIGIIGIPGIG